MQRRKTSARREGEVELLRRIRDRAAAGGRGGLRLGIGDDCALLRTRPDEEIAVTTDLSLEGRHFRLGWHAPESIGHRTLARGLSDLAAMGARPLGAFLSLGVPAELTSAARGRSWIDRFYDGLLALARAHNTPLAGGDLAESPVVVADIVLVGAVPAGGALLRSGARPGDILYVTGELGGAAAGLATLAKLAARRVEAGADRPIRVPRRLEGMVARHLYPEPRIAQGLWLQRRGIASAAMDLSDGLSSDLARMCEESGVSAEVEAGAIPVAAGATLEEALHGGEDYELLFAARPAARVPRRIGGVAIARIGHIARVRPRSPQVALRGPEGLRALKPGGWEHFAK
ncbi:thiamine-phosphate kinase [Acidobacteria bacterium AB60]|nr:thiamine-phosphate kinase [Acidobacteria bacterium AB60]